MVCIDWMCPSAWSTFLTNQNRASNHNFNTNVINGVGARSVGLGLGLIIKPNRNPTDPNPTLALLTPLLTVTLTEQGRGTVRGAIVQGNCPFPVCTPAVWISLSPALHDNSLSVSEQFQTESENESLRAATSITRRRYVASL